MQEQPYHVNQVENKQGEENQYQRVNEDLIRLREMNTAFAKLNQNYLHQNYEYYLYNLQQTSNLSSYQVAPHQTVVDQTSNDHNTERSNSLLFTLSQKDEQQTRPTTKVQNPLYENNTNSQFQVMNSNRFGKFQYDANISLPVNNTIFQQGLTHHNLFDNLNYTPTLQSYYQMENIQPYYANEHVKQKFPQSKQLQPSGFSKYEEFAIKISRLFNIQVEDLEIIYNQLKTQKEKEQEQLQYISYSQQTTEISDSQVMKKLFSHALQIKNSHTKLKKIIKTIDHRKQRTHERPVQHISQKMEFQNVSINFMIEAAQNKSNSHPQRSQKEDKTKRLNRNLIGQRQINQATQNHEMQNMQSKNTIIERLVRHKVAQNQEIVSGKTIQSKCSIGGQSANTHTKSHKLKKNSRVSQKIRLISEQLESLKKQIDLQEESNSSENNFSVKEQSIQELQRLQNTNEPQNKVAIQFQNQLNITQKRQQLATQSEPYAFGGQSFTYAKSIQEIPIDDPQIDRIIQQTIKNSIVKSPSKKSQQLEQLSNQIKKTEKQPIKQGQTQKIIVEPAPIHNQHKKFSFKQKQFQSQVSQKSKSSLSRSQSRQKMFKSIAEIRKSRSKEKNNNSNQSIKIQGVKTSNNPYLENNQQFQGRAVQVNDRLISQNYIAPVQKFYSIKPSYMSSNSLNDGKFLVQRNEIKALNSRHNIQQYPSQLYISTPVGINRYVNSNDRIKYPSGLSAINAKQIISFPISNLGFQPQNKVRNTISYVEPPSLYSVKTIQSKSQIGSQRLIKRPDLKQGNEVYIPNQTFNSSLKQRNVGNPQTIMTMRPQNSRNIPNQRFTLHPSVPNLMVLKEKLQQYVRPITPINKIENFNLPLERQKQRSFSTQRLQPNRKMIPVFNAGLPQHKFEQAFIVQRGNQQFSYQELKNNQLYTRINERKVPQRAFSVPIRATTPQKKISAQFKQTLIEKPASLPIQQQNLVTQSIYKFSQNPARQNRFQASNLAFQFASSSIKDSNKGQSRTNQQIIQAKTPYFSQHTLIKIENQPRSQNFIGSKFAAYSASKNQQPQANQVRINPRLEESEMYYGNLYQQIKPNIQDINLIGSKKFQSIVHTFPVQLQQSQKMNNSVYANQQIPDSNSFRLPRQTQGQIPKVQTLRIPQNMKPPKYIPPKQLLKNSAQFNNSIHQRQLRNKSLQRYPIKQSITAQPPVKTYTMGHLVEASKVENYMRETQKSHTALNASNVGNNFDLFESTPSFGKANEQNSSQTFFISPKFNNLHHMYQSRNSSESKSKRSSSSRQRTSKKGIALESKRPEAPSHKFIESSYNR